MSLCSSSLAVSCRSSVGLSIAAVALFVVLRVACERATAQAAGIEVQWPWAYTRHIDRPTGMMLYMATTPAIGQGDFWLLLACRQDGQMIISFIHNDGFPYPLGSPTNVSLHFDAGPAIAISASALDNRQISIEPVSSSHLLRQLAEGRRLFVTVADGEGGVHDYKLLLQPNDLALKDIRTNCLDPFFGHSRSD